VILPNAIFFSEKNITSSPDENQACYLCSLSWLRSFSNEHATELHEASVESFADLRWYLNEAL